MTVPIFARSGVRAAFAALRQDLIHEDGPRISTMRSYRFAIVQYLPHEEYTARGEVQQLSAELTAYGWVVFTVNLQKLLLDRIRSQEDNWAERVIEMERRVAKSDPERGLGYLAPKLANLIEGPDGIAADCSRVICDYAERHPDKVDRMLAIIGRAGALYPWFRSSALLRHLDGNTCNVPVVVLYPGEWRGGNSLSFMGMLNPDNDYRPRIYS
jgi:hypothetical protein